MAIASEGRGVYDPAAQLKDSNPAERRRALEAIWMLGGSNVGAYVDELRQAISDEDDGVRWRVLECLRATGLHHTEPAFFLRALNDSHYYVRHHAFSALAESDHRAAAARVLADRMARSEDWTSRLQAACDFRKLEDCAASHVDVIVASAVDDEHPWVRREAVLMAATITAADASTRERLVKCLIDPDEDVRVAAAQWLLCSTHREAAACVLLQATTAAHVGATRARSWNALVNDFKRSGERRYVSSVRLDEQAWLLPEAAAQGVFPTLGAKSWTKGLPVTIPGHRRDAEKEFPWQEHGLYHHWQSYRQLAAKGETVVVDQICFHANVFGPVHLVAVAQLIGQPPQVWDPCDAPVVIEDRPVGPLLHGGGVLHELPGMRRVVLPLFASRVDFCACVEKDVRVLHSLVLGASTASPGAVMVSIDREVEAVAAEAWVQFETRFRKALKNAGLGALVEKPWFTETGVPSIRYGRRYEIEYRDIAGPLQDLLSVASSPDSALATTVREATEELAGRVEGALEKRVHWLEQQFVAR